MASPRGRSPHDDLGGTVVERMVEAVTGWLAGLTFQQRRTASLPSPLPTTGRAETPCRPSKASCRWPRRTRSNSGSRTGWWRLGSARLRRRGIRTPNLSASSPSSLRLIKVTRPQPGASALQRSLPGERVNALIGDSGLETWLYLQFAASTGEALWIAGRFRADLARVDDDWKISTCASRTSSSRPTRTAGRSTSPRSPADLAQPRCEGLSYAAGRLPFWGNPYEADAFDAGVTISHTTMLRAVSLRYEWAIACLR